MAAKLPLPNDDEREHSRRLAALIRAEIDRSGPLDFARYMELALYAPGLGYYAAGKTKFGAAGDYVTAPELGSLFAQCVAHALAPVLRTTGGDFLELGAGSGAFAADALLALAQLDAMPGRYRILEPSADLRERQALHIRAAAPQFYSRVEWLDVPPVEAWHGVLFANEVIDALPVQRFEARADGTVVMETVAIDPTGDGAGIPPDSSGPLSHSGFRLGHRKASAREGAAIAALESAAAEAWQRPYRSEYLPQLAAWFATVTQALSRGVVLFVDYGYPRREYYLHERRDGTLRCHYRHHVHDDPLALLGLQDITAFVDFTAVAEAGVGQGFELAAYLSQASLLMSAGRLPELFAESAALSPVDQYRLATQVKRLTLPGEMGERFKAIAFARGIEAGLLPFAAFDQSPRL